MAIAKYTPVAKSSNGTPLFECVCPDCGKVRIQDRRKIGLKGDLFEVTLEEIKSSSASRSDYKRVIKSVDRHFAGKDRRLT